MGLTSHLLLQEVVEGEIEAGEGYVPGQGGPQAPSQPPQPFITEDGLQRSENWTVLKGSRLDPGLDDSEGNHDGASEGPGGSTNQKGLACIGFALEDGIAHPVHWWEVEANPRHSPGNRYHLVVTCASLLSMWFTCTGKAEHPSRGPSGLPQSSRHLLRQTSSCWSLSSAAWSSPRPKAGESDCYYNVNFCKWGWKIPGREELSRCHSSSRPRRPSPSGSTRRPGPGRTSCSG